MCSSDLYFCAFHVRLPDISVFAIGGDKTELMDSDDAGHLNKCMDENHALAEHIYNVL